MAVELLFMSTASGSRVGFHVYCHFLVAIEVAVEMAVDFQSGSRKKMAVEKLATHWVIHQEYHFFLNYPKLLQ